MTDHRCARRPSPGAVAAALAATVLALTIPAAPAGAETCAPVIVLPLGPCQSTVPSSPRPTATASPAPVPTTAPVAPAPAPAVPAPVAPAPAPASPADRATTAAASAPPASAAPATPSSPASPARTPSASVPQQPAASALPTAAPTAGGAPTEPEAGERGTVGLGAALLAGGGVLVSVSAALGLRARRLRLL